ncbi:putative plant self-incompatibility S1 [Medicago truncatula]|uniref:S-protein homolog n=1 Tax=Medicago truncatula TaxID=3880 RepID=A0A072UG45_MEDTR|nr:S-protein homolog 5 [Medicago truncatula]KEH24755.1 leguminosin group486 secreted peptide [Medicago truncatula]RHN49681.1 putative plant self-incompatibility S1 [Medicago truncatula]
MVSLSKFALSVSMLLAIIFVFQLKGGNSFSILKPVVHMYITNNLTNGEQLGVHCKDKDHDIGYRAIHFQEPYAFTFRPAFFISNTLYFCGFNFGSESHYFDVYVQDRDEKAVDKECHWQINKYGPCRVNVLVNPNSIECFPWPSD